RARAAGVRVDDAHRAGGARSRAGRQGRPPLGPAPGADAGGAEPDLDGPRLRDAARALLRGGRGGARAARARADVPRDRAPRQGGDRVTAVDEIDVLRVLHHVRILHGGTGRPYDLVQARLVDPAWRGWVMRLRGADLVLATYDRFAAD